MVTTYKNSKRSYMAKSLADDVINHVRNRKKVNLYQLQIKNGYTPDSAKSMKGVKTKTYQEIVNPVIERMKRVHEKAIEALEVRDMTKEKTDSIVNVAKQMIHDTQLLQGKATDNVASQVVVYGSDDFLALTQSKSDVK